MVKNVGSQESFLHDLTKQEAISGRDVIFDRKNLGSTLLTLSFSVSSCDLVEIMEIY
jgi:hypothetical protein